MRRFVGIISVAAALVAAAGGAVIVWRRDPRVGSAFVNSVVNPRLLRRGLAGGAKSELGTLEHVGRVSGVLRLTPVHPEPTPEGFRVLVPLGPHSQWARNVIAAGHCRLQLHDVIYELDEPKLDPGERGPRPAGAGPRRDGGARVPVPHASNVQLPAGQVRTGRGGRCRT